MSARVEPLVEPRLERGRRTEVATLGVALAGVAVLAVRPFVGASPEVRAWLFAAAYASIAVASIRVPAGRDRPRLAPPAVLAVGIGGLAVATAVAGPPVPAPTQALALPLSLLAALAEELLFRRVLYSRLAAFGAAAAIGVSAALFALVHLPAYGTTALPVDLGAGLLFGWQRWASGSWTVPAATHGAANLLAVLR